MGRKLQVILHAQANHYPHFVLLSWC